MSGPAIPRVQGKRGVTGLPALRWMMPLLVCVVFAGICCAQDGGGTGTCRILDYKVQLTPHPDGRVTVDYYQKWRVEEGVVSQITIGTPNADYVVKSYGGDAVKAKPASGEDWSEVRLDLDKAYGAGQVFETRLTIIESKLFSVDDIGYHLEFTPGWYNRSETDAIEVRLKCFFKPDDVTAVPPGASRSGDTLVWSKADLRKGECYPVAIVFSRDKLSKAIPVENLRLVEVGGKREPTAGERLFRFVIYAVALAFTAVVIKVIQRLGRAGEET